MKVLIDNGYAKSIIGRRSPDRSFYVWEFNRIIAIGVVDGLEQLGYEAERIVLEEDYNICLNRRIQRVNKTCREEGRDNVIFISINVNAAGDGKEWRSARGFCAYVSEKLDEESMILAKTLFEEADKRGYRGNRKVPKGHYWPCNYKILANTLCTSVQTGNLFYNNKDDLAILKSEFGKKDIIDIHVTAINEYLNGLEARRGTKKK